MKYMLLIHQVDSPTPRSEAWQELSEEEQGRVYADYKAISETPGVSPGLQLDSPETATTIRVEAGRPSSPTGRSSRSRSRSGATCCSRPTTSIRRSSWPPGSPPPGWAGRSRCVRSSSGSDPRADVPRPMGPRDRGTRRLPRRLGCRRGVAQEAFAIAAERWPREGTPAEPVAWLITTARNRAINRIRRERTLAEKTKLLDPPEPVEMRA